MAEVDYFADLRINPQTSVAAAPPPVVAAGETDYFADLRLKDESVAFGSLGRGLNRMQQAGNILLSEIGIISPSSAAKAIARDEADIAQYPVSPTYLAGMEEIGAAKGWGPVAWAMLKNPSTLLSVVGESIPASGAMLAGAGVGAVAGAVGGAAAGGPVGAAGGMVAGAGLGSFATEYASSIIDVLQEAKVDTGNADAVEAALQNPDLMHKARDRAVKRGIPVAMFDAISFGMAGKIAHVMGATMKEASRARKVAGGAAETVAQAVYGGAGEAAGEVAAGQPIDPRAIGLEAAAEVVTGAPEIAIGVARQPGEPPPSPAPGAPGAVPPETIIPPEEPPPGGAPPAAPAPTPKEVAIDAALDEQIARAMERPDSPRLTMADRTSPIPNDLIDEGKSQVEVATGKPSTFTTTLEINGKRQVATGNVADLVAADRAQTTALIEQITAGVSVPQISTETAPAAPPAGAAGVPATPLPAEAAPRPEPPVARTTEPGETPMFSAVPGTPPAPSVTTPAEGKQTYRADWRNSRQGQVDPKYFDIVEDVLNDIDTGEIIARKDKLVAKPNLVDRIPAKAEPGVIYRGISADDYANIQKTGQIVSSGDYNMSSQAGLTYYGTNPQTAESYANSFAPAQYKPTFDKPAYVIAVRMPPANKIRNVPGTGTNEVGVIGSLPASDIVAVYRGDVAAYDPGVKERGVTVAPSARLHWQEITPAPTEPTPQMALKAKIAAKRAAPAAPPAGAAGVPGRIAPAEAIAAPAPSPAAVPRIAAEPAAQVALKAKIEAKRQAEAAAAPRAAGEADKEFAKRVVDKRPAPKELPEKHSDYFIMDKATVVPIGDLVSSKTDEENRQGGSNAAKRMEAAAKGELAKRQPITVERMADGKYLIKDGNGTYTSVKDYGWKSMPVLVEGADHPRETNEPVGAGHLTSFTGENATPEQMAPFYVHPFKTVEAILEDAQARQDELGAVGKELANKIEGVKFKNPGLKKTDTLEEKIERKGYENAGQITDAVRIGFDVSEPGLASEIIRGLARHFEVLDEGWGVLDTGYFDRKILVRFDDGRVGEVQFWEPHVIKAKEKGFPHIAGGTKGSNLYDEHRSIKDKASPRAIDLERQMLELYGYALSLAASRAWSRVVSEGKLSRPAPKYLNLRRQFSSDISRQELMTSEKSASTQLVEPGLSSALASKSEKTTGRLSQLQNFTEVPSFPEETVPRNLPEAKFQARTIREGTEVPESFGLPQQRQVGKKLKRIVYTTRQIAAALEARQRARYGTIARDDRSPEARDRISDWIVDEVEFEQQPGREAQSGVGWYSTKFQRALNIFGSTFPELLRFRAMPNLPGVQRLENRKNARDFMTALIAVTSDGQLAAQNFENAARLYGEFRQTGTINIDNVTFGADRNASIKTNLANILHLLEQYGPADMHVMLMREETVSDLKRTAAASGATFSTQYQAHVRMPLASLIFGPKLGAFYANLMGAHGYLTMDRWWSRTFNRYRGQILRRVSGLAERPTDRQGNKIGLARFKEMIGQPNLSDEEALVEAAHQAKIYSDRKFKNGTDIEKTANTIAKAALGTEDQPFTSTDRTFMIETTELARQKLADRGIDISIADIQAILWYFEKRLYSELGARATADISYEEVAQRVTERAAAGARPGRPAAQDVIEGPDGNRFSISEEGRDQDLGRERGRAAQFVSPNVAEGGGIAEALQGLGGERQRALQTASREIDDAFNIKGESHDAIGAWSDGAENTSVSFVSGNENWDKLRVTAAMKGHLADQKAVLIFKQNDDGTSALYRMHVPETDVQKLHENLIEDGVAFHTIVPQKSGIDVIVVDLDGSARDAISKAAERYDVSYNAEIGQAEFIGTSQEAGTAREQRDDARRAYEEVIRRSPVQNSQELWSGLRDRWGKTLEAAQFKTAEADAARRQFKERVARNEELAREILPGQRQAEAQRVEGGVIHYALSPAFAAKAEAVFKDLRKILDSYGLTGVDLKVWQQIFADMEFGAFGVDGMYLQNMIHYALTSQANPDAVMHHEVVHALWSSFTDTERAILSRKSRKEWVTDRIKSVYPEEQWIEEGVAHAHAEWRGGTRMDGVIAKIFRKINLILKAVARALTGQDFRTAEDIFRQMAAGEIGRRSATAPAARRPGFATPFKDGKDQLASFSTRPSGPNDPRFHLTSPPNNQQQAQQVTQGFLNRGQVVDRAIRTPFSLFGGLDAQSIWRPSKRLSERFGIGLQQREAMAIGGIPGAAIGTFIGGPGIGTALGAIGGASVGAYVLGTAPWTTNGSFNFLRSLAENAKRGLISDYGLDPEYIEAYRRSELGEAAINRQAAGIMKVLAGANVGTAEAEVLQQILSGKPVNDAAMTRLALPIRQAIDALGAEAVSEGLISAESFERNRGAYLHRVYLKYEADVDHVTGWVARGMAKRRKKIIGDEMKGRGIFWDMKVDRLMKDAANYPVPNKGDSWLVRDQMSADGSKVIKRVFLPSNRPVPMEFSGTNWVDRGAWEVRQIGKTDATLWRDYTEEERGKMGEIVDARYTITKTFMLAANDLSTGKFYREVSEKAEWTRTTAPPDAASWKEGGEYNVRNGRYWEDPEIQWVKVPDTNIGKTGGKKRWGALAGKFVRAEIWRDLNEINIASTAGTWRVFYSQWKKNKTSRNPVVHMNNIMSNVMWMDLADVRARDLVAGIHAYFTNSKDYIEARDNGAFGTDIVSQELRQQVLKPILDELAKQQTGTAVPWLTFRGPFFSKVQVVGTVLDKLWTWAKYADDRMLRAYQAEDEIFRMAAYMRRRSQGEDATVSALNARDQFLNYDIRAPWVVAMRNSLLPFVSYTYRAVPKLMENIQNRPWKIIKYVAVAYAVNALAYMLDEGDDDEDRERAALRDEEQGHTWLGTPRMLRMPWRDAHGLPVFLDVRRWIPAGDIFDTTQGNSAVPIPAPLLFGGPIELAFEFRLNRQAFTGEDITNSLTQDNAEKASSVADWAWKSWAPASFWTPNSWYWTKISNAIHGATDTAGHPYSVPQAFLSSVGIKVKPVDVEDGIKWHYFDFKKTQAALEKDLRSSAYQLERGLISQKAFDAKEASTMRKFENLEQKVEEFEQRTIGKK